MLRNSLMPKAVGILSTIALLSPVTLHAEDGAPESADALAALIKARTANEGRTGVMTFSLENARGQTRTRASRLFHEDTGDMTRIAIHFVEPAAIEGTAFLSHDSADPEKTDETWLFLPSTERVRRLPSSDRGDAFMGTDLSYGDIKDNFKFEPAEWTFSGFGETETADGMRYTLEGTIKSAQLAKELGYGSFIAEVDPETWFPVYVRYTDEDNAPLKEVRITEQKRVGDAWTATAFTVVNLQREHKTEVVLSEMAARPIEGNVFEANRLDLGLPRLD